ncbi:MAG: hypothetical protein JST26_17840 [Bacteroidetes bacterium]|nr:hypothetical protein [Bacteroidota bacterium]
MKKIICLSLLMSHILVSQNIKYSFSEEFETVKKHVDMGFYKFDNKFVEGYYRKGDDMIFQIYDDKFNTVKKEETVTLPDDSKHFGNEGFFSVKNDYFWFYSTWDRGEQTERLFALPFNKSTFKFGQTPVKLVETDKLASVMGYGKYSFNYSTDSTMMLVTYRVKPKERNDKLNKDIIGFNLFDHQMRRIYTHEIEMPYTEAEMDNLDYEVDSRGNIYMLTQVKLNNSLDGEKSRENRRAYRYELVRVNQQNNTLQSIKIDLKNKYTRSVMLSEDLHHDLVITGYYSNKESGVTEDGAYIIKLEFDEKNAVKNLNTTYCEFPTEVLKAYETERQQRKMEKKDKDDNLEAANLELRHVEFNPDGSMVIIGEEYYSVTTSYYDGKTWHTTTTYYYNDIIVLKADKDGKTQWCCKIPKSQVGKGTADLSFHFHKLRDEYYFFYLDNIKNINLPLDQRPASHSSGMGGYLTCVKIDAGGKMTKKSIFDTKEEKVRLRPQYFESIGDNLIVDRLREDRKHSMVFKLEIK